MILKEIETISLDTSGHFKFRISNKKICDGRQDDKYEKNDTSYTPNTSENNLKKAFAVLWTPAFWKPYPIEQWGGQILNLGEKSYQILIVLYQIQKVVYKNG